MSSALTCARAAVSRIVTMELMMIGVLMSEEIRSED